MFLKDLITLIMLVNIQNKVYAFFFVRLDIHWVLQAGRAQWWGRDKGLKVDREVHGDGDG